MTNSILLLISTTELSNVNIPAIVAMLIPIVAIVMNFIMIIKKNYAERDVRKMLIQNGIDKETAAIILKEEKKERDPYSTLRAALLLIGIGLTALCCHWGGVTPKNAGIFYWLMIGLGCGLGFLVAFIVERLLRKQDRKQQ